MGKCAPHNMDHKRHVILDLRETATIRGFHLLSALKLASANLADLKLHYASNGTDNEMLAIQSCQFDSGLVLFRWWGEALPFGLQFDSYVAVAEGAIADPLCDRASDVSRKTVLGLTFPAAIALSNVVVIPANDISAFAHDLCSHLTS